MQLISLRGTNPAVASVRGTESTFPINGFCRVLPKDSFSLAQSLLLRQRSIFEDVGVEAA